VNQNACYYACALSGSAGWNLLLVPICQSICITEACASGILVSHPQMEKASVKISPCFNACMDAYQQEAVGTDEVALKAAAQKCAGQCGFAQTLKSTPGATKVAKAGGSGGKAPTTPSAPTAPAASRAGAGSGLLIELVVAAVAVGIAGIAATPGVRAGDA
jgi:hypothetical protein